MIRFSPYGNSPLFLPNGSAAGGYHLYVYEAGTTTKVTIYNTQSGISQHTNPIVLQADGYPPSGIYLDANRNYRFVYASPLDFDPPTSPLTTPVDNVAVAVDDAHILASEWTDGPTPTYISSTQFSLAGDQTANFHVARRIKAKVSGGAFNYGTITASAFTSVTTITITPDSSGLNSGLSAVWYSFLSGANSAWPGGWNAGLTTVFTGPVHLSWLDSFNIIPAGLVVAFAGISYPPPAWFLTNGAAYSRTGYPNLYNSILTTFGIGNGSTTFNVPTIADLQANVRYVIRYA